MEKKKKKKKIKVMFVLEMRKSNLHKYIYSLIKLWQYICQRLSYTKRVQLAFELTLLLLPFDGVFLLFCDNLHKIKFSSLLI